MDLFQIIDTAVNALKLSTTDPYYRKQCWEVTRCYLIASMKLDDDKSTMQKLFNHPRYLHFCCFNHVIIEQIVFITQFFWIAGHMYNALGQGLSTCMQEWASPIFSF